MARKDDPAQAVPTLVDRLVASNAALQTVIDHRGAKLSPDFLKAASDVDWAVRGLVFVVAKEGT